jgi:hypothetical protein
MPTKLIRLEDGTLVEIETSPNEAQQISGGSTAKRVEANFDKISPILQKICRPLTETWKELSKEMLIEQAEVEIGLSFEGEGNLYITKSKASANLKVKLVLKQKISDQEIENSEKIN